MDAYSERVISEGFTEVKGYIDRSLDDVFRRLDTLEAVKPEPGPPGSAGKDGTDGKDGAPGLDGAPGKDGEAGRDGEAGKDGLDGKNGLDGLPGAAGLDGKDGVGLAGAFIDREGELVVTKTDGTAVRLGRVNGHDGAPGKDGLDGLGAEDLTILHDGDRTVTFSYAKGDKRIDVPVVFPVAIYRGVYKRGSAYDCGDLVTWGGNCWHCKEPTIEMPGDGRTAWVLAVKEGRKGQDGKDGKDGERGPQGIPGRDGRALT